MKGDRLKRRNRYLEEAMLFRDADLIKVSTGARRIKRRGRPLYATRYDLHVKALLKTNANE